ncbi:MAG: heme biosynthesis protein HemY [Rhodospirillales bacterium]|nr:heme biosynthesis protein HemY [Rhodospirillales bacterium]
MLRALWFAIKVGFIMGAAVWVANRPGTVALSWLGYDVRIHVGLALIALLLMGLLSSFIFRLLMIPRWWRQRRQRRQSEKGYRALTIGMSAVAAGDARMAARQLQKVQAYLPRNTGLALLLEAQTARLQGHNVQAQQVFEELLGNKDTAFLGLRGLMIDAFEKGDGQRSLVLARQALQKHPKQPWLLRMVYDLETGAGYWDEAEKTLKKALRYKALSPEDARRDGVVLALCQAEELLAQDKKRPAVALMKKAHKTDPAFVPAALRLAGYYRDQKKRKLAAGVVERTWKESPHPELALLWGELAPKNKPHDSGVRLRWFEKLVAAHPKSVESQMAAAQAALEDQLWGEAEQYLKAAERLQPSARLYRLWSRLALAEGQGDESREWLERAADAPAGKVWSCRETGQIFERWRPLSGPNGPFNTIEWGYPSRAAGASEAVGVAAGLHPPRALLFNV